MVEFQTITEFIDNPFGYADTDKRSKMEQKYQQMKSKSNLKVEKQKALPLIYEEVKLDVGYRIDMIIEDKFIVEVKSVEALTDVHLAQLLTYLRLSDCRLGLLINFNVKLLKEGVRRVINRVL